MVYLLVLIRIYTKVLAKLERILQSDFTYRIEKDNKTHVAHVQRFKNYKRFD